MWFHGSISRSQSYVTLRSSIYGNEKSRRPHDQDRRLTALAYRLDRSTAAIEKLVDRGASADRWLMLEALRRSTGEATIERGVPIPPQIHQVDP